MTQSVITRSVATADLPAIAKLHAHVFGPGRFVRSAYRVREGKGLLSKYCRVADLDGRLIATLRLTEIAIGGNPGAALLGPLTVDPDFAGQGYGRKLVSEALENMKTDGVKLVVLVGDESYYGRLGIQARAARPDRVFRSRQSGPHPGGGTLCPARSRSYRGLIIAA